MEPNYNLDKVLPLGVLTGSRAFNCATKESDWDIVLIESNVPKDYINSVDWHCTNFNDTPDDSTYYGKPGYNVSEFSEFEDEDSVIPYNESTIWGPLQQIIKYIDDNEVCINLFVYKDHHEPILQKFRELNNLMNFIYNVKLKDRSYRVQAFTEIINKVGITNYA